MEIFNQLLDNHLLIYGKARQLGFSWAMSIYALWKAKFNESVKVLMLSQGEEEAWDLIGKCVYLDNNLPAFLRESRNPDSRGNIGFQSVNSEIKALPSTEKAGRGTDATVVICDEWEFHPFAEQNFGALKPTIDAGGQFIALSTADTTKLDTFFKRKYQEAKTGVSQFKPYFYGWQTRPGRDQTWFDDVTKDLTAVQRQGEYPATESDMLNVVKARKFFEENAIEDMKLEAELRKSVECELTKKYKGLVTVWKLPVVGEKYLIATDPSDGKEDPHAIIVTDKLGEQMAQSHGLTTADICAQIHDDLVRFYNNALNTYELTGRAGGLFSEKLKMLDTPNQAKFISVNGEIASNETRYGWWSGKALWQKFIWGLEEAVRQRQIKIYSKDCLWEFGNFIVPEGQDPQKARGAHDDFIDAWARVWFLRKYIRTTVGKATSFKYGG